MARMEEDETQLSVWVGALTREELDAYLAENYERADDEPVSKFAADNGATWIDHDWIEATAFDAPTTIEDLLRNSSYAEEWLEAVVANCDSRPVYTCAIMLFRHVAPAGPAGPMTCLGAFRYVDD
ncbi:immunity 22 family protein [Sandaracinus amylolyticus]|uniref:Uncharacterized protein n=1 Tax=Sandaracinus amylolyticus TaxID=927083 RepID=A0A0F6YGE9_9BACT|nr:immunity 22 family protein [Sandaracinus amylolyticus]AKF03588.1 hypothetical protein DB32_000737 [Sandaracinus amylolyticus]